MAPTYRDLPGPTVPYRAPVVPQDYLSEGGSILFLVGEGGEGLHVRTLSDFLIWGGRILTVPAGKKQQQIQDFGVIQCQ